MILVEESTANVGFGLKEFSVASQKPVCF